MPATCVLGDSSPIFLAGLKDFVTEAGLLCVADCVQDRLAIPEAVSRLRPDIVIIGFEPIRVSVDLIATLLPPALLMTWSHRTEDLAVAVESPARGIVHKDASPAQLHAVISAVLAGYVAFPAAGRDIVAGGRTPRRRTDDVQLTPREEEILTLLATGMATKQVASRLGIAPQTVKNYLQQLKAKTGIRSRMELCLLAGSRTPQAQSAPVDFSGPLPGDFGELASEGATHG